MTALSDDALRELLRTDPAAGWRAFVDQHTPLMLGLIRRAGLVDRDEVMDVYARTCEQLSANGFERLRSQDGARGSIGGWLAVVTRHAVVDWIRSQKGRRRLFQAVRDLTPADQRVFELYYWDERPPGEIAEILATESRARADLASVFDALERVQAALTDRHRAELLAMSIRTTSPVALDDAAPGAQSGRAIAERAADAGVRPDAAMRITELNNRFEEALAGLSAEDAAIVRLKYVEGLPNSRIERALGVTGLTTERLQRILGELRARLNAAGVDARDLAFADRLSLDRTGS